jgi:hypothetical protein
MAPWISAADVIEAEEKKSKEYFYNYVLGLPVIGDGLSVDRDLVLRARQEAAKDGRQKFIGVDVGGALHVVIGNEHGITKAACLGGKTRWAELDKLISREQPTLLVIDNGPADKQVDIQRKHPHRVLRCVYDYNDKRKENWFVDRDEGVINAHRTRVIDDTLDDLAKGVLPIYMDQHDPYLDGTGKPGTIENCLAAHWSTLYVVGADGEDVNVVKKDRMGNVIRTWENAGPDHFAHATIYYRLAREAGRHFGKGNSFLAGGEPGRRRREDDDDDDRPKGRGFYS